MCIQTSYGNGAPVAADTYVGIFVVSAILSIVMFKTIKVRFILLPTSQYGVLRMTNDAQINYTSKGRTYDEKKKPPE